MDGLDGPETHSALEEGEGIWLKEGYDRIW
jgi:hypothetical protein